MHCDLRRLILGGLTWISLSVLPLGAEAPPSQAASAKPWSFAPMRKTEPPADPTGWSANVIDRFVYARQREHGLQPASPTDPRTLIRRTTFDLIGLPPTPEEVAAFLADRAPD